MIYEAIDYWNSPSLEHHGVKGMKWGVRHDRQAGSKIAAAKQARANRKAAWKKYSSDYDVAAGYDKQRPFSTQIKGTLSYDTSKKLWKKSDKAAENWLNARREYKAANKKALDYKRYDSLAQWGQTMLYNPSGARVFKVAASAAKKETKLTKKVKAWTNAYMNTPYRYPGLLGTWNTTQKREFTGRW